MLFRSGIEADAGGIRRRLLAGHDFQTIGAAAGSTLRAIDGVVAVDQPIVIVVDHVVADLVRARIADLARLVDDSVAAECTAAWETTRSRQASSGAGRGVGAVAFLVALEDVVTADGTSAVRGTVAGTRVGIDAVALLSCLVDDAVSAKRTLALIQIPRRKTVAGTRAVVGTVALLGVPFDGVIATYGATAIR